MSIMSLQAVRGIFKILHMTQASVQDDSVGRPCGGQSPPFTVNRYPLTVNRFRYLFGRMKPIFFIAFSTVREDMRIASSALLV